MELIKPFKAFHYNPQLLKEISSLVCPPYDLMSREDINRFKKKHPYNFCNVLCIDEYHNYKDLSKKYSQWIDDGILVEENTPSLYLYQQRFRFENKNYSRVGIVGLLRIDNKSVIFPHENTLPLPKKDRYYIIKNLKSNLTPIFVVVPHRLRILHTIHTLYGRKPHFIKFKDFLNIDNTLWRIDEKDIIHKISKEILSKQLFIADGHHRFEVAYRYFLEERHRFKDLNYILAYFTDWHNGLLVLPTHRVLKNVFNFENIFTKLSHYFKIEEIKRGKIENILSYTKDIAFGIYKDNKQFIIKLKKRNILDKILNKEDKIYKNLDVYILHRLVLPLLDKKDILYTSSLKEAKELGNKGNLSFILKRPLLNLLFNIAKKGYLLPEKSTYFYPKIISGLLIRRFEN
ncbi:MAG: DUF1015 domain-containing protein [Candidatus Omnitrophica bacterium]|nr:DUF1015 domain-containing protein [Candidatus Omnitrophota bacterium]MCM8826633.1 DUF1015 domain-containing protein [Candidatus Omnitrophota bacterium]